MIKSKICGLLGLARRAGKLLFGTEACIKEISKTIGQCNKAIIGIKDTNFSNEIIKIINGGEAIG